MATNRTARIAHAAASAARGTWVIENAIATISSGEPSSSFEQITTTLSSKANGQRGYEKKVNEHELSTADIDWNSERGRYNNRQNSSPTISERRAATRGDFDAIGLRREHAYEQLLVSNSCCSQIRFT